MVCGQVVNESYQPKTCLAKMISCSRSDLLTCTYDYGKNVSALYHHCSGFWGKKFPLCFADRGAAGAAFQLDFKNSNRMSCGKQIIITISNSVLSIVNSRFHSSLKTPKTQLWTMRVILFQKNTLASSLEERSWKLPAFAYCDWAMRARFANVARQGEGISNPPLGGKAIALTHY